MPRIVVGLLAMAVLGSCGSSIAGPASVSPSSAWPREARQAIVRTLSVASVAVSATTEGSGTAQVVYERPDRVEVSREPPPVEQIYIGDESFARLPGESSWSVARVRGVGRHAALNQAFLALNAALPATTVTTSGTTFTFVSSFSGHATGAVRVEGGWIVEASAVIDSAGGPPIVVHATYSRFNSAPPVTRPPT